MAGKIPVRRGASRRTRAGTYFTLEWRGDELKKQLEQVVSRSLVEVADMQEGIAKGMLAPGRGVLTGTLQRSIHAAARSYDWTSDWPGRRSRSTPELDGIEFEPDQIGSMLIVACGSGLRYAHLVEDLFQFVQRSHERVLPEVQRTIQSNAASEGLT